MKIIDNVIHFNRGDENELPFRIPLDEKKTTFYEFQIGDVVTFGLYPVNGYDKTPLILKKVIIEKPTDICQIPLESKDTRFTDLINEPVEYWYEVSLNKETVLGHTKEGPRVFWLLPEGSE